MSEGLVVPSRADVLGQAVPFDRARWLSLLPDATWWPERLDACPREGRWLQVDRRTVFEVAESAGTADKRRHLLVAALVWGSGTKARAVDRRGRVFARSSAADLDARLAVALARLSESGADAGYYAFNNEAHIPELGPAFFTKVLYFAGGRMPVPDVRRQPLILDRVVSLALRDRGLVDATWPSTGWTTPQYSRYLDLAHETAREAGVEPDVVEAALFGSGRRLSGPSESQTEPSG
ncbi:hypothetical protein ACFTXJ_17210 [Streptomyces zhihengii]|uniref:8-oxoguanine DNA glycosylase OGG fold protein n=1 Tax=Streptomyces zhihengii TaxID=1818004 RepID=UPI00362841AA